MGVATERAALLAGVLAEPESDEVRLVFADWCEENGEPERAEFVRVQVELARLESAYGTVALAQTATAAGLTEMYAREEVLHRRERELWAEHWRHWWAPLPPADSKALTWRRGFVEHVTLSAADWLRHADAIRAAQPVRAVTLTTVLRTEWNVPLNGEVECRLVSGEGRGRWFGWYQIPSAGRSPPHCLLAAEWPRITFTLPGD